MNSAASLGPNAKGAGLSLFHDVFLRHIRGNGGINYGVPREANKESWKTLEEEREIRC